MATVCSAYPTPLATNESAVEVIVRLKVPFSEVVVPVVGAFLPTIDTPDSGSSLSFNTLPLITLFCACVDRKVPNNNSRTTPTCVNFLFIRKLVFLNIRFKEMKVDIKIPQIQKWIHLLRYF